MRYLYINGRLMPCAADELSVQFDDVNRVEKMADGSSEIVAGDGGGVLTVRFLLPYEVAKCECADGGYSADEFASFVRRCFAGGGRVEAAAVAESDDGVEVSRYCVCAIVTEAKMMFGEDGISVTVRGCLV